VSRSAFRDNGISGLVLGGADHALVARNSASGTGDGYAFALFATNDSVIRDNVLDGNEHGVLLAASSSRTVVERNAVAHSAGSAIDLGDGAANDRVQFNRLADNGDGIIVVDGGERTTVAGNVVTGGRGPAIFVTTLEAPSAPGDSVVTGNVAGSKLDDGIRVDGGATGILLALNVAGRSGDDGIDVAAGNT
jgi:nitrous oxidase accessory protein NosD